MQLRRLTAIFCILLIASGCATIVSRSQYPLRVNAEPRGAEVVVTDGKDVEVYRGKSPTQLNLKSGGGYFKAARYQVRISATGYQPQTIPITFKLNNWYFGNIVFGGIIGALIVDPITGAMWRIKDPIVDVQLGRSPRVMSSLRIMTPDMLTEIQKAAMVRIN